MENYGHLGAIPFSHAALSVITYSNCYFHFHTPQKDAFQMKTDVSHCIVACF